MQASNLSWRKLRATESYFGDSWVLVTPFSCTLKTSNAELISQVTSRMKDFPKPIKSYRILNIFGRNIVSSEGQAWKRHKKVVGGGFGERSNRHVFEESLRQGRSMIEEWLRYGCLEEQDGEVKGFEVRSPAEGTATLSLHVICAAGFGVPQLWAHEGEEKLNGKGIPGFSGHTLLEGHRLSMKKSLAQILHLIRWVVILPTWFLSKFSR